MIKCLEEVVTNTKDLLYGHIIRDGFIFTSVTSPANVYDAIVIKNPNNARSFCSRIDSPTKSLEEQIRFINENKLEKALIIAENIDFITDCPTLKYINVIPADNVGDNFDYSPLYKMPQIKRLRCTTEYCQGKKIFHSTVDYSNISGLEDLGVQTAGDINFNKIQTLKSLQVNYSKETELKNIFCSAVLDTLVLTKCRIKSLEGLQQSEKMQCLYLHYNRSLRDISALAEVKNTLRALRIENCPDIEDFSVISELENLEFLQLSGNNTLPDLHFLKKLPRLKTFIFSMNVLDGDLSPCLDLSYVCSEKNRKHYNLKDKELPKESYVYGNESIEAWRRLR